MAGLQGFGFLLIYKSNWSRRLVVQDVWFSSRKSRVRLPSGSPIYIELPAWAFFLALFNFDADIAILFDDGVIVAVIFDFAIRAIYILFEQLIVIILESIIKTQSPRSPSRVRETGLEFIDNLRSDWV